MIVRLVPLLIASGLLSGCLGAEEAAPFGQARNGEALARQWCSGCHVVAPDQQSATADRRAPSFSQIAASQRLRPEALRRFLAEEHLPMPTFRLRKEEREDIVAYIGLLRGAE